MVENQKHKMKLQKYFGISRSYVSRIEKKAIGKLNGEMSN